MDNGNEKLQKKIIYTQLHLQHVVLFAKEIQRSIATVQNNFLALLKMLAFSFVITARQYYF